jgi:hypothetical protein
MEIIVPQILALDESEWSASLWEESPRYPLDKRLGGPQSRSGRCGVRKVFAPTGNQNSAVQPVAIPTELMDQNVDLRFSTMTSIKWN